MDHPPITSPPSILVQNFTASHGAQRPSRRSSSHTSSKAGPKVAMPVSIPNTRDDFAPPPLPPPRHLDGLDDGHDPGWRWGNTGSKGGFGSSGLSSVSPVSSLRGNWDKNMGIQVDSGRMEESRRGSSASKTKSPSKEMLEFRFQDEGYHSLSGSSLAHQSVFSHLSSLLDLGFSISIREQIVQDLSRWVTRAIRKNGGADRSHNPHS